MRPPRDGACSCKWPETVSEQDEYKQFRWLLQEERSDQEAKVGKLGSIQFASALLMGLASTFIGQVTVPDDGSMDDGIIVAFALFAVLTVQTNV
jgi:hypothetical protein